MASLKACGSTTVYVSNSSAYSFLFYVQYGTQNLSTQAFTATSATAWTILPAHAQTTIDNTTLPKGSFNGTVPQTVPVLTMVSVALQAGKALSASELAALNNNTSTLNSFANKINGHTLISKTIHFHTCYDTNTGTADTDKHTIVGGNAQAIVWDADYRIETRTGQDFENTSGTGIHSIHFTFTDKPEAGSIGPHDVTNTAKQAVKPWAAAVIFLMLFVGAIAGFAVYVIMRMIWYHPIHHVKHKCHIHTVDPQAQDKPRERKSKHAAPHHKHHNTKTSKPTPQIKKTSSTGSLSMSE